jgi:hypothetical protein
MYYTNFSGEFTFNAKVVDRVGLDDVLNQAQMMVKEGRVGPSSGNRSGGGLSFGVSKDFRREGKNQKLRADYAPKQTLMSKIKDKLVKEEELDEISKATLLSYRKKAGAQAKKLDKQIPTATSAELRNANSSRALDKLARKYEPYQHGPAAKKLSKRREGIASANERLSKSGDKKFYRMDEEQIDETSKCNKMKKKDHIDPKKREKEEKNDFDPRRMLSPHNRKKVQVNEWRGTRFAKRMYSGDAPPKGSDKPHKSPAMQRALDKIGDAYSPDNVKKMMSDKKAMQKKPKLDEVSRALLGRYLKKSTGDADSYRALGDEYAKKSFKRKTYDKVAKFNQDRAEDMYKKSTNRNVGFERAIGKLTGDKTYKKKMADKSKVKVLAREESINEVSASKLGRYTAKANVERDAIQKKLNKDQATNKEFKKGVRRVVGSRLAVQKLTGKSKVPASINEVSKGLLGRYIKKASDSRATAQSDAAYYLDKAKRKKYTSTPSDVKTGGDALRKVINRRNGIRAATDKLTGDAKIPSTKYSETTKRQRAAEKGQETRVNKASRNDDPGRNRQYRTPHGGM